MDSNRKGVDFQSAANASSPLRRIDTPWVWTFNAGQSMVEEIQVGPDKVLRSADSLVVLTKRNMPDWRLREFCRIPIYFRGRKYWLKDHRRAEPPFAEQYDLEAWPESWREESNRPIKYDEFYVDEREAAAKGMRRSKVLYHGLMPLFPLLGFCWSGTKHRWLAPLGFDAVDLTGASIVVEVGLLILAALFIFILGAGFIFGTVGQYALLMTLFLDCVLRAGRLYQGDRYPPGFLEWGRCLGRSKGPDSEI